MSGAPAGPAAYVEAAERLGWGPASGPEAVRLALIERWAVGPEVLDVGAAGGVYVDGLARAGRGAVGLDFARELLQAGRSAGRVGDYVAGSALALPFAGASFATLLLFGILEHLDDAACLVEARRVARERVIALVPQTEHPVLVRNGLAAHHRLDRTHLRSYTAAELRELFERSGFAVLHLEPVHPLRLEHLFYQSLAVGRLRRAFVRRLLRLLRIRWRSFHDELAIVAMPKAAAGIETSFDLATARE